MTLIKHLKYVEHWGELGEMVLEEEKKPVCLKSKLLIIAERKQAESLGGVWVTDTSRNIDLEVVTVASIISCVLADMDPPAWAGMGPPAPSCPFPMMGVGEEPA